MPRTHHDREGDEKRERERNAALDQADEGQRREQQHRALREIEHAGSLVDQHEADRDERIHHAGQQAADQHFGEKRIVEVEHQAAPDRLVVMRDAEIGVDDRRIGAHLRRRPVGDLAAVVENGDAIRQTHHDADVVLDQNDRRAEFVARGAHEPRHLLLFGGGHARHRLVEQQDFRPRDQCARKFDAFLQTIGKRADQPVANGAKSRNSTIASARARASSLSRRARPRPTICSMKLARRAGDPAAHDIVENAQAL